MAGNQASHILTAATDLALRDGLRRLVMRSVAAAAGVTPSAIVYHFKTRDGLLAAVLTHIGDYAEAACTELAHAFDEEQAAFADPAAVAAAVLGRFIDGHGMVDIVQSEIARLLRGSGQEEASRETMRQAFAQSTRFWQTLPRIADEDAQARAIWAAFARGIVSYAMLDRNPVARSARIIRTAGRLADRLAGRPVAVLPPLAPTAPPADIVRPAGKQQIVEATIRLSGAGGVESLTHRAIAAEAGLSLASTTYFYPGKDDIVADAARELQARAMAAVMERTVPIPRIMSRITLDDCAEERAEMAALAAFTIAAIRVPELAGVAAALRRVRGIGGARWLEARGCQGVDRLDGVIWSAISTTLGQDALLRPKAERAPFLDDVSEAWLRRIFG